VPFLASSQCQTAHSNSRIRYLIERGKVVWSGTSPKLAAAPQVQHRYLGV
jgi:ABC-type branched-subunit amino acid transport system ATPase component